MERVLMPKTVEERLADKKKAALDEKQAAAVFNKIKNRVKEEVADGKLEDFIGESVGSVTIAGETHTIPKGTLSGIYLLEKAVGFPMSVAIEKIQNGELSESLFVPQILWSLLNQSDVSTVMLSKEDIDKKIFQLAAGMTIDQLNQETVMLLLGAFFPNAEEEEVADDDEDKEYYEEDKSKKKKKSTGRKQSAS